MDDRADLTLDDELRATLAARLDGIAPKQAARAVERLIASYRGRTPTDAPVLRDEADVTAYAAYRMPATFQAVRAALAAFRARAGEWAPRSHLDVGGGTGAATWAVADAWPQPYTATVLDWAQPALDLGQALAAGASHLALRTARWQRQAIGAALTLPAADLVTVSYVLGELADADRESVIAAAATAGRAVLVAEPGTPAGYARILEARARLTQAGFTVLAPCPHGDSCPLTGDDWCHFAARVSRSALHRQVKGGQLAYEDEKFSYVAAIRDLPGAGPAAGRVVRHPQIRKGQVLLDLCEADGAVRRTTVSKRHGDLYRAARDTDWGDPWPPPQPDAG
ncbi:small ribosomal subunit Rsm22 family protein [Streptantibioticus silvisoli]|uniref:Small ribosomal subunit Rsm22 family protein n=1 Tax=Streptantibioticus silvisoli TaxID=2705255 RepID=A0ABT6VT21_9ACTN|nr:small ribosomal subunit Rsm22 family protein [Streptantibioticus silvisoli]MDI5961628.1 small ribosomal subunit Rsm22 family protein [Streptantibioticus silvisoli]